MLPAGRGVMVGCDGLWWAVMRDGCVQRLMKQQHHEGEGNGYQAMVDTPETCGGTGLSGLDAPAACRGRSRVK